MKVSRAVAAQNRARTVEVAARLFRERGVDGVAIADIMGASGLTHGGFYSQFESKEALAAEALRGSLDRAALRWRALVADAPDDAVATLVRDYVSPRQRDNPGTGCVLTALGPDCARKGGAMAGALTGGVRALSDILAGAMGEGTNSPAALALLSQMVGAVVLSRAVDDPVLAQALLDATLAERAG